MIPDPSIDRRPLPSVGIERPQWLEAYRFQPDPLPSRLSVPGTNAYGRGFVSGALTEVGGDSAVALPSNQFAFEFIDATDSLGPKVLILDGLVIGQFGQQFLPTGMGANNFVLNTQNLDVIWLVITLNTATAQIASVTIDHGTGGPPSDSAYIKYAVLGTVVVDGLGTHPENSICGDYLMPNLSFVSGFDITGSPIFFSSVSELDFVGAIALRHNPANLNGGSVEISVGPDVSDENGVLVETPTTINFTRADLAGGAIIQDVGGGTVAVSIPVGVDVTGENSVTVDNATLLTLVGIDVADNGGGEATLTVIGRVDVSDGTTTLDNNELLTFTGGAGVTISNGGGGEVLIDVPGLTVSDDHGGSFSGANILHFIGAVSNVAGSGHTANVTLEGIIDVTDGTTQLDNQDLLHFVGATITNGGGGEAIITISATGITVSGDSGSIPNAAQLEFVGAVITSDGSGGAFVTISPGSGITVTGDTGSQTNPGTIHFIGATVSSGGGTTADVTINPGQMTVEDDLGQTLTNIGTLKFSGFDLTNPSGGVAEITAIDELTVEGSNGSQPDITTLSFPQGTLTPMGSGTAEVEFPIGVDVHGEVNNVTVDNATLLTFPSAEVFDNGGGEVLITFANDLTVTGTTGGAVSSCFQIDFQHCSLAKVTNGRAAITPFGNNIQPSGTWVLGTQNGAFVWISVVNC